SNDEIAMKTFATMGGKTVNDLFAENSEKKNSMKSDGPMLIINNDNDIKHDFKVVEKGEPLEEQIEKIEKQQPTVEKEIVNEILHTHDTDDIDEPLMQRKAEKNVAEDLELEIKTVPDKPV